MASSFGQQLRAAREAAGLSRTELARRLMVSPVQLDKYENDRVTPSGDRQREILAACRKPSPVVAAIVQDLRDSINAKLDALANDLETLQSGVTVTPAAATRASEAARQPVRRPATRSGQR